MIRVPAVLVGVVCAGVLTILAFLVATWLGNRQMLVIALPMIAGTGGFIAGRWAAKPAPVPGLAVAIITLAVRLGLGLSLYDALFGLVDPGVALLELIAAITGGLMGTMIVRRLAQQPAPEPDFQAS